VTRSDLDGMTALVTGGGTGIGLGIAKRLAEDGALVTICGRRAGVLADATKEICNDARFVVRDVTDDSQVAAAVEAASEPYGRLDIAVANAGSSASGGPLPMVDVEGFEATFCLNVTRFVSLIPCAAPLMGKAAGGSLLAVSSIAGHLTHRNVALYCVAKAGLEMLVRNAADELGPCGIRVNAVRPGLVPTDAASPLADNDAVLEDNLGRVPLGRVGTPEEVAAAVRFLVGPEASWITGQLLGVDGTAYAEARTSTR